MKVSKTPLEHLESPKVYVWLLLWALNDHVLKPAFGNEVTGKLSDVACLIVIPFLFAAGVEVVFRAWLPRRALTVSNAVFFFSIAICTSSMVLINTSTVAAQLYRAAFGLLQWPVHLFASLVVEGTVPRVARVSLTMDPTDLWTCAASLWPLSIVLRSR